MSEQKFDVVLVKPSANKPAMVKVVLDLTGSGLRHSKDLVDNAPSVILGGVSQETANGAKSLLELAGAKVEIKPSK